MKFSRTTPSHIMNSEMVMTSIEKKFIVIPDRIGKMNRNMFREDFRNIFMGINRGNPKVFDINSNSNEIQEEIVNSFLKSAHYSDDESVFQEILENIIENLLYFGKALYFLHNPKLKEQIFRPLVPSTIFKTFGIFFQYLPHNINNAMGQEDEHSGREVRLLNTKQVLYFEWPHSVRKKIEKQNRILDVYDKYAFAGASHHIAIPTHENPNPKNYFDYLVWKDIREATLFEATKYTGWNARESNQTISDFFICHRMLRFRRLQVETCVHLLNALSKQLTMIGKLRSSEYNIQISFSKEFPSLSQFDEYESALEREEVQFSEVLDFCFQQ